MTKILLVTTDKIELNSYGLGSSKDITHRVSLINKLNYQLKILAINGRNDNKCRDRLRDLLHRQYFDIIIFEHAAWPKSIKFIKKNFQSIKILLRCHNEEILHNIDMILAFLFTRKIGKGYINELTSIIVRLFKTIIREIYSIKNSKNILICNDGTLNYFQKFKNDKYIFKVNTNYDIDIDNSEIYKLNQLINPDYFNILLIGSEKPNLFNDNSVKVLLELVNKNKNSFIHSNIKIIISGLYNYESIPLSSEICNYIGVVKNPYSLIKVCDAVFLPTKYGRGIKTRIFDSIVIKKPILIHKNIHKNLPFDLKQFVTPWDGNFTSLFNWIKSVENNNFFEISKEIDKTINKYRTNSDEELKRALIN